MTRLVIHDEWFLDSAVAVQYRQPGKPRSAQVILEDIAYQELDGKTLISGNRVNRNGIYPKAGKNTIVTDVRVIHEDLITSMRFMAFNQYTCQLQPMTGYLEQFAYRTEQTASRRRR